MYLYYFTFSLFQIDAFLQHFSNIFVLSPPAKTFQDCIDTIRQLNQILQTPYLTAFEFVDFNEIQPAFQKINFPGVKALSKQQLEQLFKEFTDQKIKFDADYDFLQRQTIYVLQYLYYVAKRISANIDDQQIPYLLFKAWIYRLKIDYECLKEQVDNQVDLAETIQDLEFMWFNKDNGDVDQFIDDIDKFFKQIQSALIPIYDDSNLLQNLNHLLAQSQLTPINVPNDDTTIIGVESQMTAEQNIKIALICQKNLSYKGQYMYYLNSLYAIQQIGEQFYQIKEQPVSLTIKQLIAQLYISQINTQNTIDENKMFSLLIFLLTGVTYLYNEQEFYLNLSKSLAAVNDLIQKIFVFPPDIDYSLQDQQQGKIIKKRKFTLFANCGTHHTIINSDDVILNMKRLSYILEQYAIDNRQYIISSDVYVQDRDLSDFLNSLGGIETIYMVSLKLYNQLQSMFINKRILSIIEGLYYLTKSALYGGVQNNIIQYVNSGLMGTKLNNIEQFLQIVGAKIEVQTTQQNQDQYDLIASSQQDQNVSQIKVKNTIPSVQEVDEMLQSDNKIEI